MTNQKNEKRQKVRVTFRTTVKLVFSGGRTFAKCETVDVSVAGLFVKNVTGIAFGEKCKVELNLSGRTSNLVLEMTGEVVRSQEDGVALQFLEVDEDSFYHLQNIVYFSYKHSGGVAEILTSGADVDDETLYMDLDAGRKLTSLPGNYLDEDNGEDDDSDDGLDDDIVAHVKKYQDDDGY